MKRQAKVLAVLLMMFVVLVGQSSAQEMGRWIVHTTGDSAVHEAARQGVGARAGLTLKELPTRNGLVVLIPDVAIGPIAGIPGVVAVEPDVVLTAVAEVLPWGVDRIDADLAWGTATGDGVAIAIIDTGIDKDHPDLAVAGGTNFVRKGRRVDPDAWDDDNGHGTHCAGIAAALDNDIGVVGVAPAALLYGVKVLDRTGSGYLSDVMDGIYWAADNGMEVINLSLGIDKDTLDQYPSDRDALQAAVDYADGAGVVVVAAAGNEGNGGDTVIYPARFASAIAVSATDSGDNLASFSSTGDSVELAAPGVSIYSTYKDGGYATGDGTSMASPHVAGVAALAIAAADVRDTLTSTAEDLGADGRDPYYGHGLVDAAAAVGVSEEPPEPTHDVAVTSITAPSTVVKGDVVGVDVTVANEGTYAETFTVTLTDETDGVYIDSSTVSLAAGASAILTYSWDTSSATLGDHTLTASHNFTDDDPTNDSMSITVTVKEAGATETMHVANIEMELSIRKAGPNIFTRAVATVTIVDASDAPVAGATVYGYWEGATSDIDSGVTDSSGKVTLESDAVKNAPSGTTFTFIVDDVVKSGFYWIYDDKTGSITVP